MTLLFAEHFAVVECEMGLVDEQIEEFVVRKVQFAAVEPYEERGLRAPRTYSLDIFATVVLNEPHVVLDIFEHVTAPFLTVFECGDGGYRCKQRSLIHLVGLQPAVEFSANLFVRHYGIATYESGDVESLRRSLESYTVFACSFRDRSEWDVLMSEYSHIAMNLVADDDNIPFAAEISKTDEGLTAPAHSCGVVGIAQNEQFTLIVGHTLQVVEVHLVCPVVLLERIEHHLPSVA